MSDRRTIAHVVSSLDVGGLERVVVDLVNRLDPARYESVVCCLEKRGALADDIAARARAIESMDKAPGKSVGLWFRLGGWMRRERVDIVHAHNFGPLLYGAVAARIAQPLSPPPVIYTLHGPEAAERRDYSRLEQLGLVARVVSVSNHVREVVLTCGGVNPSRVVTIHNGVDVAQFGRRDDATRRRVRASLGLEDDHRVVAAVARLSPEKDHATLVDAFARVLASHPGARLLVIGDGPLRGELEERARNGGIGGEVLFLGTRRDVPELLGACDLFAMSSNVEGLGITLIEAMAAGLATVATASGGIPEVVDDSTGRLVPAGDVEAFAEGLRWMLDHPDEATEMGRRGMQRARDVFSVEAMVSRYQAIYDALEETDVSA